MSQQQPPSTAPSRRPHSIEELAAQAAQYNYDPSGHMNDILLAASQMRKQGDKLRLDGDIEAAYILYIRAAGIAVDKLPHHRSYSTLTTHQRNNLLLNGQDIVAQMEKLKPLIRERYEKYQAKQAEAFAASERVRAAREAQAQEAAAMRAQKDQEAGKHRDQDDAAARQRAMHDARREAEDRERQQRDRDSFVREQEERRRREEETRRRHEEDERRRRDEARRKQEEEARHAQSSSQGAWDLAKLGATLDPSPARNDDDFSLPIHPLQSPARLQVSRSHSYPPPITTTSAPPADLPDSITYPKLMTRHQREQGYTPSLQSMFAGRHSTAPEEPPPGLLFQDVTRPLYSHPIPTPSQQWSRPYQPQMPVPYPRPQPPVPVPVPPRPPKVPASEEPPVIKASELPADVIGPDLKVVAFPRDVLPRFVSIAALNTSKKRETCGLLLGRQKDKKYIVTTLLIPKQHATSDTCTMDEEELVLEFQSKRDLLTLGWIHTHPTQSCFMSSVDLHTHAGFQSMLPESFAVVCAPSSTPNFGIFRLTDPPGLRTILSCNERAFHPHPPVPIYTDADKGHVQMQDLPFEIADLR